MKLMSDLFIDYTINEFGRTNSEFSFIDQLIEEKLTDTLDGDFPDTPDQIKDSLANAKVALYGDVLQYLQDAYFYEHDTYIEIAEYALENGYDHLNVNGYKWKTKSGKNIKKIDYDDYIVEIEKSYDTLSLYANSGADLLDGKFREIMDTVINNNRAEYEKAIQEAREAEERQRKQEEQKRERQRARQMTLLANLGITTDEQFKKLLQEKDRSIPEMESWLLSAGHVKRKTKKKKFMGIRFKGTKTLKHEQDTAFFKEMLEKEISPEFGFAMLVITFDKLIHNKNHEWWIASGMAEKRERDISSLYMAIDEIIHDLKTSHPLADVLDMPLHKLLNEEEPIMACVTELEDLRNSVGPSALQRLLDSLQYSNDDIPLKQKYDEATITIAKSFLDKKYQPKSGLGGLTL